MSTNEKFEWTPPSGGPTITLPPISSVKSGVLRRHRRRSDIDFAYSVLEDVLDEKALEQTDELGADDLNELFSAWMGSATPGESGASST